MSKRKNSRVVRYAVVGLGDIAQAAVLPAFANAKQNSDLCALFSDDPKKLEKLSRHYNVADGGDYGDYDAYLRSGKVDAVYIALPNSMHCDFAVRAANAGIHVLCEKPLAVTEDECQDIIQSCAENGAKLMTAYRLHFERANLEAVEMLKSGKIGEPRIFQSLFSMQVRPGNIRTKRELGGGTLYDIGIYCINAARYLFRAEPLEVFAFSARSEDTRFEEIDEMTSAVLRFPEERLASFTTSFGATDAAVYTICGTQGWLRLNRAYEYTDEIEMELMVKGRSRRKNFPMRDQFAAEIIYFSDCILKERDPEPSGIEGLLDVHIIRCLYESARHGVPIKLKDYQRRHRPDLRQEIHRPPSKARGKVHVQSPSD